MYRHSYKDNVAHAWFGRQDAGSNVIAIFGADAGSVISDIRKVMAAQPTTPIFCIVDGLTTADTVRILDAGADDVVSADTDGQEIFARVESLRKRHAIYNQAV